MDLSGLSAFGSAIGPGYTQGQSNQAVLAQQQEAAKQARFRTEEMIADREATVALGNFAASMGIGPPSAPPTAAATQPLAATSTGSPAMPPGQPGMASYLNPSTPAPPLQPLPGPPPAAPPAPMPPAQGQAPAPQGQPPASMPTGPGGQSMPGPRPAPAPVVPPPAVAPPPSQALQQGTPPNANMPKGMMTTEELAQRIRKANPGIKPDVLVRAMSKAQALLAPDAKQEVALLQIQQKIDMANQKFELGQMSLDNKLQAIQMANQVKIQLEGMRDKERAGEVAVKTTAALDMLITKLSADLEKEKSKEIAAQMRAETNVAGRQGVAETNVAGRKDVAEINAGAKGISQQRLANAAQIGAINRQISEMLAGGRMLTDLKPEEKQRYDGLVKQRDALAKKDQEILDRAGKAGVGKLPKLQEVITEASKKPATAPPGSAAAPIPPAAQPEASALPDEAKAQLKEGVVTTFGNGQRWTLENGQPKQVP